MSKLMPIVGVICSLLTTSVCFSEGNIVNQKGLESSLKIKFISVFSANTSLVSDDKCKSLMSNEWSTAKVQRLTAGNISSISSISMNLSDFKNIYRDAGPLNTYVHVWEGNLQFMLDGKLIVTPAIVSSFFKQGNKEENYMVQSLYCNGMATVRLS